MKETPMPIDYSDYLNRFERRELGPEHFDHEGHLLMAWVHLQHYDPEEATQRVCDGVRELASAFGAPEKYSHTLTIAFMRIIMTRMQGMQGMQGMQVIEGMDGIQVLQV
jgi:hypothetical protein